MFNNSLKKEAFRIHEETLKRYNASYDLMSKMCEQLYEERIKSVEVIKKVEKVINSIANTPKEFDTKFGEINQALKKFMETEKYAKEAYEASVKAGVNIFSGAATGMGIATMAPTAMMSIATTFGTATTGTAISALSGAAAQKAAVAWIGRTFVGFAVKEGAGMAVGQAFLALAGPVGWGITAGSTALSLVSLTNKNKKIADDAINEAKEIAKAREALDEVAEKVSGLKSRTIILLNDMNSILDQLIRFMNVDYNTIEENDKLFLGTIVNNTLTLSALLNETIQ